MADPAREYKRPVKPTTLREAKVLAMTSYQESTAAAIKADAEILARFNR